MFIDDFMPDWIEGLEMVRPRNIWIWRWCSIMESQPYMVCMTWVFFDKYWKFSGWDSVAVIINQNKNGKKKHKKRKKQKKKTDGTSPVHIIDMEIFRTHPPTVGSSRSPRSYPGYPHVALFPTGCSFPLLGTFSVPALSAVLGWTG